MSRCLNGEQVGCVRSAPADVSTLVLVGLTLGLDVMQTWSAYRILRFPSSWHLQHNAFVFYFVGLFLLDGWSI